MMSTLAQSSDLASDEKKSGMIRSLIQMYGGDNLNISTIHDQPPTIATIPYRRFNWARTTGCSRYRP